MIPKPRKKPPPILGGRKTIIHKYLGTGMILIMPVPLLSRSIHGNIANEVIFDMHLLLTLAAGLVGRFHINRLYKLSEGVWRAFCERGVSAYLDSIFINESFQFIMVVCPCPMIRLQFFQLHKMKFSIFRGNTNLHIVAPISQSLLTDTTWRKNLKI